MYQKLFIVIIVIFICWFGIKLFVLSLNPFQVDSNLENQETSEDYGVTLVITDNLLISGNFQLNELDGEITGVYFDGIRLYIELRFLDEEHIKALEKSDISITNEEDSKNIFRVENIYNINDRTVLAVCDYIKYYNSDYYLNIKFTNDEVCQSEPFSVNGTYTEVQVVDTYFDEIKLNKIINGMTSSLIDFDLFARAEISGIMIETDNGVFPGHIYNKDGNNYQFIIPSSLSKSGDFILYGIGADGNVAIEIPIEPGLNLRLR